MNHHDDTPRPDEDEVVQLVRRVLRDDDGGIPADLQPSDAFWESLVAARSTPTDLPPAGPNPNVHDLAPRRQRPNRSRVLLAAAACAAIIGAAALALHLAGTRTTPVAGPTPSVEDSISGSTTPALTYALYKPADYPDSTCVPGTLVHPTRTPSPAADTFTGSLDPNSLPGGDDRAVDPRQPFHTDAFDAITEVGGCVQAWIMPRGSTPPADATPFTINGTRFAQRTNADGLTEVSLERNQTLYVAASGNATPHDLALALDASTTAP